MIAVADAARIGAAWPPESGLVVVKFDSESAHVSGAIGAAGNNGKGVAETRGTAGGRAAKAESSVEFAANAYKEG
jgi:hypothetical protein